MSNLSIEFVAVDRNYTQTVEGMIAENRKLLGELKGLAGASDNAGRAHEGHGRKGVGAFQKIGANLLQSVIGPMMAMVSVGGVFALIHRSYETWVADIRAVAAETNKAAGEMLTFAALQQAGTRAPRLWEALRLGEEAGIGDRGEVLNTIQAMQSAYDSFEGGISASREIFNASQVGIPVELGREIETFGHGAGFDPGQALRYAYIAGEISSREPKELANVGPALTAFPEERGVPERELPFAMATALAEGLEPGQLGTYVRRAGVVLGMTGSLKEWFAKRKLEKASRWERLQALEAEGIDTEEELQALGVGEIRERVALSKSIQNMDVVRRTMVALPKLAKPRLLTEKRGEMEAELPQLKLSREIETVKAMTKNEMIQGPRAIAAQKEVLKQQLQGFALRKLGYVQGGGMSFVDKDERSTWWDINVLAGIAQLIPGQSYLSRDPRRKGEPLLRGTTALREDMRRIMAQRASLLDSIARNKMPAEKREAMRIDPAERLRREGAILGGQLGAVQSNQRMGIFGEGAAALPPLLQPMFPGQRPPLPDLVRQRFPGVFQQAGFGQLAQTARGIRGAQDLPALALGIEAESERLRSPGGGVSATEADLRRADLLDALAAQLATAQEAGGTPALLEKLGSIDQSLREINARGQGKEKPSKGPLSSPAKDK